MRIAVLADIKANEAALDAVLDHCEKQEIDRIWVIGSLLSFGPDVVAIVDRLRFSRHHERCLIGHPDGILLGGANHNPAGYNPTIKKALRWAYQNLHPHWWSGRETRNRWNWLQHRIFHLNGDGVNFFSGTPVEPAFDFLPVFAVEGRNEKLIPHFNAFQGRAFVGGIGRPGITFEDSDLLEWHVIQDTGQRYPVGNRKFIACPGSVGQPRDGDPRAAYAVYDGDSVTWHRVPYDIAETQRRIRNNPHLSSYYAERLEYGR